MSGPRERPAPHPGRRLRLSLEKTRSLLNSLARAYTPEFLDTALRYAREITSQKIVVRMDAGNDDFENVRVCRKHKVDYLIKENLRKESLEGWLEEAQAYGDWESPREGKEVYTGETWRQREGKEYRTTTPRVARW